MKTERTRPNFSRHISLGVVIAVILMALPLAVALADHLKEEKNHRAITESFTELASRCSGDRHVRFGGFKTNTFLLNGARVWPVAMAPRGDDTDKWMVLVHELGGSGNGEVTSLAYCAEGHEPKVVRHNEIIAAGGGGKTAIDDVTATCPEGKVVLGGGFSTPKESTGNEGWRLMPVMAMQRTSARTLQVAIANERDSQQQITAIALCGAGPAPKAYEKTIQVNEGTTEIATAKCGEGKEVEFGGFVGSYYNASGRNAFIFGMWSPTDTKLSVRGDHNSIGPNYRQLAPMTAIAYCR